MRLLLRFELPGWYFGTTRLIIRLVVQLIIRLVVWLRARLHGHGPLVDVQSDLNKGSGARGGTNGLTCI